MYESIGYELILYGKGMALVILKTFLLPLEFIFVLLFASLMCLFKLVLIAS